MSNTKRIYSHLIASDDDNETRLKKFLFKLLHALHNAGHYGFKTEKYIARVGYSYNLHAGNNRVQILIYVLLLLIIRVSYLSQSCHCFIPRI